jgi:Fur family peroxide stress response transcriptional regulator
MKVDIDDLKKILAKNELKVTPQRLAILKAIYKIKNHPTADNILENIRKKNPNISAATVYNVLDAYTEKGLIKKVNTYKDYVRYEAIIEKHHHLYEIETDKIEDYFDEELDEILKNYFKKKQIKNFEISEIQLNIKGKFIKL